MSIEKKQCVVHPSVFVEAEGPFPEGQRQKRLAEERARTLCGQCVFIEPCENENFDIISSDHTGVWFGKTVTEILQVRAISRQSRVQ